MTEGKFMEYQRMNNICIKILNSVKRCIDWIKDIDISLGEDPIGPHPYIEMYEKNYVKEFIDDK